MKNSKTRSKSDIKIRVPIPPPSIRHKSAADYDRKKASKELRDETINASDRDFTKPEKGSVAWQSVDVSIPKAKDCACIVGMDGQLADNHKITFGFAFRSPSNNDLIRAGTTIKRLCEKDFSAIAKCGHGWVVDPVNGDLLPPSMMKELHDEGHIFMFPWGGMVSKKITKALKASKKPFALAFRRDTNPNIIDACKKTLVSLKMDQSITFMTGSHSAMHSDKDVCVLLFPECSDFKPFVDEVVLRVVSAMRSHFEHTREIDKELVDCLGILDYRSPEVIAFMCFFDSLTQANINQSFADLVFSRYGETCATPEDEMRFVTTMQWLER